jgi:hypothetical protein
MLKPLTPPHLGLDTCLSRHPWNQFLGLARLNLVGMVVGPSPSSLDGAASDFVPFAVRPTSRPGIRPTHCPVSEEQEFSARQYWKGKLLLITRHQQRGSIISLTELMRLLKTHDRPPRLIINVDIVWELLQEDQYRFSTFICVAANRSSNWRPSAPQTVTMSVQQPGAYAQDGRYMVEQAGTMLPTSWASLSEQAETRNQGRPRPSSSTMPRHRSRSPMYRTH